LLLQFNYYSIRTIKPGSSATTTIGAIMFYSVISSDAYIYSGWRYVLLGLTQVWEGGIDISIIIKYTTNYEPIVRKHAILKHKPSFLVTFYVICPFVNPTFVLCFGFSVSHINPQM